MNHEDARTLCRKYVKAGVLKHHAKNALLRERIEEHEIDAALAEYEMLRAEQLNRQRRFTRLWAGSLFVICMGAFLYSIGFAHADRQVYHFWLLGSAMFGLFKALMP